MPDDAAHLDRLKRNFAYLASHPPSLHTDSHIGDGMDVRATRQRAAVVCWDLSHNPAGRAFVLYRLLEQRWDVELIGPAWQRFGSALWEPIRQEGLRHRIFTATHLMDVWREGLAVALTCPFHVVIVTKPRLPGLIIGLLLAEQSKCPLILDFDEDERSFTETAEPGDDRAIVAEPFGRAGTELAAHYWSVAPVSTVSSVHLQRTIGGHLVRHARDERTPIMDRVLARRHLGYQPDDFVLAFIGTVRPHKGLERVLSALVEIGDDRLKLLVAGVIPDAGLRKRVQDAGPRVTYVGQPGFAEIGRFLAAADLVPLLQDPTSSIAQSQFPAKLTDALQHGVRVVVTDTPPLREAALIPGIDTIAPTGFAAYLRAQLMPDAVAVPRETIRRAFENEFSFRINRERLESAIAEARWRGNPFSLEIPQALQTLRGITQRLNGTGSGSTAAPALITRPVADRPFDIAFFWKQNDSDLFGRRSDMVVKHLLMSGRVGRVLHFDQSTSIQGLRRMAAEHISDHHSMAAMQFPSTMDRLLGFADQPRLQRRLHVHHASGDAESVAGRPMDPFGDVAAFVASSLREAGFRPANTLAWVCPVVWGFGEIARKVGFRGIVADLIDDERAWPMIGAGHKARLQAEYDAVLRAADLVMTNNEENRRGFSSARQDIVVVPNGAELTPPPLTAPIPDILASMPTPIIGYVGNLRDRIDWPLVEQLVRLRPAWNFVFIGPYENANWPPTLSALSNFHIIGPLPYESARRCLRVFSAAIVPHTIDALTSSMNPLKVYNYLAAGLPVITTPVANLDDIQDKVIVRRTAGEFVGAIEEQLRRGGRDRAAGSGLQALSWARRVDDMLAHIDRVIAMPGARSA